MEQSKQDFINAILERYPNGLNDVMVKNILAEADKGAGRRKIVTEYRYKEETVRKVLSAYRSWLISNETPHVENAEDYDQDTVKHESPTIQGVGTETTFDPAVVWDAMFEVQDKVFEHERKRNEQVIHFRQPAPICIAYLSDLHIGGSGVDYRALKRDAEIVAMTPGMYAVFHGDGMDNWIIGKLQGLQRNQAMPYDTETALFASWLNILKGKLLAVVSGNHELWSHKIANLDIVKEALRDTRMLYGKFQVIFDLIVGQAQWKHQVRHKWKYNSIFNPTHGLEVGWDRGDVDYDIAVGGHTHIGTYFRPFDRHGKRRLAVLTGTYKRLDSFGEELGFKKPQNNGAGAIIYYPDGRTFTCDDLTVAADFLTHLRTQY